MNKVLIDLTQVEPDGYSVFWHDKKDSHLYGRGMPTSYTLARLTAAGLNETNPGVHHWVEPVYAVLEK